MAGPVLVIELDGPPSGEGIERLRRLLVGLSDRFVEMRPGQYDINVPPELFGITGSDDLSTSRPFLVVVSGPGIGDEEIFEAEHADLPDLEPLIGFTPTHDVGVLAGCNSPVDHTLTALLAASVMEAVGGVADIELLDSQVEIVSSLPGLIARTSEPWQLAFGTGELLRAWVGHPGFRLLK